MKTMLLMIAFSLTAPLALTGCDRTVETQTKTTSSDDGTTTDKKVVTEHPDGTVTQTKEKSTSKTNP